MRIGDASRPSSGATVMLGQPGGQARCQPTRPIHRFRRHRVWATHPQVVKGGCRWQRGNVPLGTSGLGSQSVIPLFVAVQKRPAPPFGKTSLVREAHVVIIRRRIGDVAARRD